MKKISRIFALLLVLVMAMGTVFVPVSAANEGDEFTLAGIGTSSLKNWAFYYTTAPKDSEDPTANKIPLSKPARTGNVANGSWPFEDTLTAYDNPDWAAGEEQNIVWFSSASRIYAYPMNKNGVHTSPIIAFTAPENGKYALSFDGSVSWSATGGLFLNAYLNGSRVENSYYSFDTTQSTVGVGQKAYYLEVELKKGEELCLVIEYPASENRANIENLKATLIEAGNCEHSGGTATCSQRATCTKCGKQYGETKPHTGDPCSVCGSTAYTLAGIGTDSLKHWSFHYTTAAKGTNPTVNTLPLSKPARKGDVGNGCWPFNFAFKLQAYDNPGWAKGEEKNIVWFSDAQYLFVYPMNRDGVYYRPVVKFTAPKAGNYTITFDGSVSWSPNEMTMDAYLNGTVIDGSGYVFSTTQGEGKIGAEGSTKEYKLTLDLKRGDEVCLVFEYSTENRGNIENLTATLNYLAAGETPDSPEDTTTTPPTTTPPTTTTPSTTTPPVSDTDTSETEPQPPVSETEPTPSETDPSTETSPDDLNSMAGMGWLQVMPLS